MDNERTELQADVEQLVENRQRWQRPTLKRLQVNLDTANTPGPLSDGDGGDISNT